jgi:hypothetical protein
MTRTILPYAVFFVTVVALWLLIATAQRGRWLLYIVVPVMLVCAAGSWKAVDGMLGYATGDLSELEQPFFYITHLGEDPVWLLAVPQGAKEPRLYVITELSEAEQDGFAGASARGGVGVPIEGMYEEGEFVFHDFDAPVSVPKEG